MKGKGEADYIMEKLRISDNNRYFVKSDGTPFVWMADTVWTMPQRLKWDDAEYLMKKRKEQGFTVLQIVALDPEQDVEMRNPAGVKALPENDLTSPSEQYFQYLDWILDKAEKYGFYVLLLPVWGQLVVGDNWLGDMFDITVTEENAYPYGKWIGNRYRDRNNLVWCLGGDRQPIHKGIDYRNVWRRMAEGLAKGLTGKDLKYNQEDPAWRDIMITYHACHEAETGECSTMSYWTDEEKWISFIMLQSGHGAAPKNYELVTKEYTRERTMPVWDGEPAYEMMPTSFPEFTDFHGSWMVRKRAYWSLMAGSFGHTYGHCNVWCSISEKEKNPMFRLTWQESLFCEGADQIRYLRAFMEDLKTMTYIPCQEILPVGQGEGEMDLHQQACVSSEDGTICVYLPSGGEVTLDLNKCKKAASTNGETCYLWWYNPRDGKFYSDAETATDQPVKADAKQNVLCAEAPTNGAEQDWILIVKPQMMEAPITQKVYGEDVGSSEIKKVFEW